AHSPPPVQHPARVRGSRARVRTGTAPSFPTTEPLSSSGDGSLVTAWPQGTRSPDDIEKPPGRRVDHHNHVRHHQGLRMLFYRAAADRQTAPQGDQDLSAARIWGIVRALEQAGIAAAGMGG